MQSGCNMLVPHSQFVGFLQNKPKLQDYYWKWMAKSFTDDNRSIKWCPTPGCEYCFEQSLYAFTPIVECKCGASFCMQCCNAAHNPTDCAIAKKWEEKSSAESENLTWIMANTKPCPKCQRPIEKNQGCNHMTCKPCQHGFCWVCLGDWKDHGSATGGYYKCNKYEETAKDETFKKAEDKRETAKTELKRYMFHYERFANHDKSEQLARKLRPVLEAKMEMLHTIKNYPIGELEFLVEACEEVQKCRQVLKWTYAYGYFMNLSKKQRDQFEFW